VKVEGRAVIGAQKPVTPALVERVDPTLHG
jgi:hypothetical protein